jgi:hypothetical protein
MDEEEINNLRKLYFLRWTGSQSQFAFENKLNYRNFSRWLIGKGLIVMLLTQLKTG